VLKRLIAWLDDRLGLSDTFLPSLRHPVPRNVNWWYVLGSATLVAFVAQVITGVALAFSYVPAPNSAYESLDFITNRAVLGSVVRGIHYFGASAMVILIVAHTVRVFLMGSYKYPREMNWVTGVLLLTLTLGMGFTGQLLRWNQDAYWAIVVGAQQAGRVPLIGSTLAELIIAGQVVGEATLTRFYATHVFVLPGLMFALIGIHLSLVMRHGISEPPRSGEPVDRKTYRERYREILARGVPFWPDAAWRDAVFAVAVGAIVVLLAVVVGPPELGERADPTVMDANPRPDWYFLWYFALLALTPPWLEDVVIVGFPALVILVLLALPFVAPVGERSPRRRPLAVGAVGAALLTVGILLQVGYRAPWSPKLHPEPLPAAVVQGLPEQASTGASLFQTKGCLNCHAISGTGGDKGPDLTYVADRLDHAALVTRIVGGGHAMPAYASVLTLEEIDALTAFLAQRSAQTEATQTSSRTDEGNEVRSSRKLP
jgi:ubiquinol-cytochrome c reductase cytochrome b subunit